MKISKFASIRDTFHQNIFLYVKVLGKVVCSCLMFSDNSESQKLFHLPSPRIGFKGAWLSSGWVGRCLNKLELSDQVRPGVTCLARWDQSLLSLVLPLQSSSRPPAERMRDHPHINSILLFILGSEIVISTEVIRRTQAPGTRRSRISTSNTVTPCTDDWGLMFIQWGEAERIFCRVR